MKKYIFILAAILGMTGCKSDYLDTIPRHSTSPLTLLATTNNGKIAINGLAKLMIRQYNDQGFNGEGAIKMFYGNYSGQHFYKDFPGWAPIINFDWNTSQDGTFTHYPWHYYYMIISNANMIIDNIDAAVGPEQEKQFIKAQALTYRAYSFAMLSQIYCYRWKDSNNGASEGLLLKITSGQENLARSTMAETYAQIYADLDQAIELFNSSGLKREEFYEPNTSVAYATYARAALNREDYNTAIKYAQLAQEDFPLMSVSEYNQGFCEPNQEWIWGSYNSPDETLYYWSFHAYIAYNSTANLVRSWPCGIDRPTYNKIPETDIRKDLFLNPGEDFVPDQKTGYGILKPREEGKENDQALIDQYRKKFPELQSNAQLYRYMQFKIKNIGQPGVGNLVHFRTSEMMLIEAESLHKTGQDTEAQKVLNKLIKESDRDPEYNCTATGEDLFQEIKFYRAIELWGEGFDFFDLKRWGDVRYRNTYRTYKIDESTGKEIIANPMDEALYDQFPSSIATKIKPDEKNNWTYVLPSGEVNYNDAFKLNKKQGVK